jgi:TolB-like protein/DNA-binding winged helix-turn-helix (wHTH) protein
MEPPAPTRRVRFGTFQVDLRSGELVKSGIRIRLQDQPFQVLALLLQKPGELVTREELQQKLWPADTFVDFDTGLNTAIKRLRDALGDSAENPRFIETLPRRGYRFIAPLEGNGYASLAEAPLPEVAAVPPPSPVLRPRLRTTWLAAGACLLLLLAALLALNVGGLRKRLFGGAQPRTQRIAVLPFENLTGDPAQEYIVDGITDSLTNDLANISSLDVKSFNSAMHYKATKESLQKIARDLKVDALVVGTVAGTANRLRINFQLVDAATERVLLPGSLERDLTDILAMQKEAARAIVQEIGAKLTPEELTRLATAPPVNPKAYLFFLQGRNFWFKGTPATPEFYEKSRDFFQSAIDEDPTYAPAHDGLSWYYSIAADTGLLSPGEAWPRARKAALNAQKYDSTLGHNALAAFFLFYDWSWPAAGMEFKKAIELQPGDADLYREYSVYLRTMQKFDEAIAAVKKAEEIDPLSASIGVSLGWAYYYARRYEQAAVQFRRTLAMDNQSPDAHFGLAKAYEQKGSFKEAIAEWQALLKLSDDTDMASALEKTYATSGYQKAMKLLNETELQSLREKEQAKREYVSPISFATCYAVLGEKDQAFLWLEKAFAERSSKLLDLKLDADFDGLHSDPRFADLTRRIGLP